MSKWLLVTALVLSLGGCAAATVELPPAPEPPPTPVLSIPLLGEVTKVHFATLELYRDAFTQTRVAVEALERLQSLFVSISLPDCLLPYNHTTWSATALEPGSYEWTVRWVQARASCRGDGTVLYDISSAHNGDRGSVPFKWVP